MTPAPLAAWCPECGAGPGQPCHGPETHTARDARAPLTRADAKARRLVRTPDGPAALVLIRREGDPPPPARQQRGQRKRNRPNRLATLPPGMAAVIFPHDPANPRAYPLHQLTRHLSTSEV